MHGKTETRVGLLVLIALGIFLYMGFKVGAFHFGQKGYHSYILFLKESGGLAPKSLIKIAGVKVGWISDISLIQPPTPDAQVQAVLLLKDEYHLYTDAYAIIRQEGMLGPRYIEIVPGNPSTGCLQVGTSLQKPCNSPANMEELMQYGRNIATQVEGVTRTLYTTLGDGLNAQQMKTILDNLQQVSAQLVHFSSVLEGSLVRNQANVDELFNVGAHVHGALDQLQGVVATVHDVCLEAKESFSTLSQTTKHICEGNGVLGKLLTDEAIYHDLKSTMNHVKTYMSKAQSMEFVFDSHIESMLRRGENYQFQDNKGYFNVRIHPNQDYFYLLQVNSSERGYASRVAIQHEYFNVLGQPIDPKNLHQTFDTQQFFEERQTTFHRFNWRVGLQLGKVFGAFAVRAGIIENTAGVGVDIDIPLGSDFFRWVTSFEAYELTGWNRRDDRRPHLKWLNSIFLFRNIYLVFGADDFISKHNGSAFIGGGIRFGDDDFKYILSTLPSNFMTGSYMIADASDSSRAGPG